MENISRAEGVEKSQTMVEKQRNQISINFFSPFSTFFDLFGPKASRFGPDGPNGPSKGPPLSQICPLLSSTMSHTYRSLLQV